MPFRGIHRKTLRRAHPPEITASTRIKYFFIESVKPLDPQRVCGSRTGRIFKDERPVGLGCFDKDALNPYVSLFEFYESEYLFGRADGQSNAAHS